MQSRIQDVLTQPLHTKWKPQMQKTKKKKIHKNIPITFTTQTDPSYLIWFGFGFGKNVSLRRSRY